MKRYTIRFRDGWWTVWGIQGQVLCRASSWQAAVNWLEGRNAKTA